MNPTPDELFEFAAGRASPETKRRLAEHLKDPNSTVNQLIQGLKTQAEVALDIDWAGLSTDAEQGVAVGPVVPPELAGPRASRRQVVRAAGAGLAAGILGAGGILGALWRNDAQAADRLKAEKEKLEREIEVLRKAGYLQPVGFHGPADQQGRRIGLVISGRNELYVSGWLCPDVIERVEAHWDPDRPEGNPAILYPPEGAVGRPRGHDPVAFGGRHRYHLDGRLVRPRVRATPFKGAEGTLRKLRELNFGQSQLDIQSAFICSPWGMVIPDGPVPPPDRVVAEWVLRTGGAVGLHGVRGKIQSTKGLPGGPFWIQNVWLAGNRSIGDEDIKVLRDLGQLQGVFAGSTNVSDAGMAIIGDITTLRWLDAQNTGVSDTGLEAMAKLRLLSSLHLQNTRVTDDGLAHLTSLRNLSWLSLEATDVTDRGLEHLKGLKNLGEVVLTGTRVTEAGVRELQAALPQCKVRR